MKKLDYDGVEKDKETYLKAMDSALDNVLDGNEVTRREMSKYSTILVSKSEGLKKKFEKKHKEAEVKKALEQLKDVKNLFDTNSIKIDLQGLMSTYISLPKGRKIPLSKIKNLMQGIAAMELKMGGRVFSRTLRENKQALCTAFNHLCLGNKSEGEKILKGVKNEIQFEADYSKIVAKTGLTKLKKRDVNGMMTALVKSGIKREKVGDFLISNLDKLKKLDKESFDQIAKETNSGQLSRLLLTAVVGISSGSSEKVKAGIKLTLKIEAHVSKEKQKYTAMFKKNIKFVKGKIAELKKYRKDNPKVTIDTKGLKLEEEIAKSINYLDQCKTELLKTQTIHITLNKYLSKKGLNPASKAVQANIDKMLKAKGSNDIGILCAGELKISPPPQLSLLTAAEFKMHNSQVEQSFKWNFKTFFEKYHNEDTNSKWDAGDSIKEFFKTGKMDDTARRLLKAQFRDKAKFQKNLIDDNMRHVLTGDETVFKPYEKDYKTMKGVPKEKLPEVGIKLMGHLSMMKNMHSSLIQYIGNLEGQILTINYVSKEKQSIRKEIAKYKKIAKETAMKINAVYKFLGKKEDKKLLTAHEKAVSPLHAPFVLKDFNGDINKLNKISKGISAAAVPVGNIGKNIKKQHKEWAQLVTYRFEEGLKSMDALIGEMESGRNATLAIHKKLNAALQKTDKLPLPSGLKLQRKKILNKVLDNVENALNNTDSPLSVGFIQKIKNKRSDLKAAKEKYAMDGLKKGVVIACVMAAAIGAAVAGGFAAGALGAKMFGSAAAGTVGAGWIPVGAGVGSFATGTLSMVGVAAGSVLGSRLTKQIFTSTGFMDMREDIKDAKGRSIGKKSLWNAEDLADEYSMAFIMSLVAVGAAKGIMKGLKHLATARYYTLRFPGLVRFSQNALGRMDVVGRIANPSTWYAGANVGTREGVKQGIGRHLARQTVSEGGEEAVEEAAGRIHPVLGAMAMVANASDGCSVNLAMHGLKGVDIGISFDGNVPTFTTATPQEFVNNLDAEFKGESNFNHKTTINDDGSVTLELYQMYKNKTTGKMEMKKYKMLDIYPSNNPFNVTPEVEMARIKGLTKVDKEGDIYTIASQGEVLPALAGLSQRGYNIVDKGNGNYKVSKGDQEFTINLSPDMIIETKAKITEWTNTPKKKSAFIKFLVKFNGNFQKFRAKFPRLAKLLPADLTKIKIPVPVIGLFSVMAFEMKSIADVAKINQHFKPGQMFSIRNTDGDIKTYQVIVVDPASGAMTVTDIESKNTIPVSTTEAFMLSEQYSHEANQASELATRLYSIGLDEAAAEIGNLKNNFLSEDGTKIKTMKDRLAAVAKYEAMHREIMESARYLHEQGGHDDFVAHITDYRNGAYKNFAERVKNAKEAAQYIKDHGIELDEGDIEVIDEGPIELGEGDIEVIDTGTEGRLTIDGLTNMANETDLRQKHEYEQSLNDALETLKGEPGIVMLNQNVKTLVIPDLHARRGELVKILSVKGADGRTNLEKMQAGELQVVVLGDGMHAEGRAKKRWKAAQGEIMGGKEHTPNMDAEMVESMGVMKMIMDLKARNPRMFHYLKGNHDNINCRDGGGDHLFMKYAFEGNMVESWVKKKYGKDFLQKWAQFEQNLPIMAIGNNFIASHSDPGSLAHGKGPINYDLEDINNRTENAVEALTWSREPSTHMVRQLMIEAGLDPDAAHWIVGHTNTDEKYEMFDSGLVRINGAEDMKYATVNADGSFNPDYDVRYTSEEGVDRVQESDVTADDRTEYRQLQKEYVNDHLGPMEYSTIEDPDGTIQIQIGNTSLNVIRQGDNFWLENPDAVNEGDRYIPIADGSYINVGRKFQPSWFEYNDTISRHQFDISRTGNNIHITNLSQFGTKVEGTAQR